MKLTERILFAVLLSGSFVAGCGSSADPPADPSGATAKVGHDFGDRALAVCAAALDDKQTWPAFPFSHFDPEHPDAAELAEVGSWLRDGAEVTFTTWLEDLQALGQPPTGRAAWADVLASVQRIKELNEAQITAAGGGDTQAFAQATVGLGAEQPKLVSATDAAGVPACANVHA